MPKHRQLDLPLDRPSASSGPVLRHRSSNASRQEQAFLRDSDEYAGRRLGVKGGDRGLTPTERMRALRYARWNYKANGLYGTIVKKLSEHTVGDGVELTDFASDEVKSHVMRILKDPRNDFFGRIEERWRDTINEGEFLLTVETDRRNPNEDRPAVPTGVVRFGRFEVESITKTKVHDRDPDRVAALVIRAEDGVETEYPVACPGVMPVQERSIVDGVPVANGRLTSIAYWSVENLAGRGTPRLMRILEKAQLVDDVVHTNATKADILNRFAMHGEYEAEGDEKRDDAFEKEFLAFLENPLPGATFVSSKQRAATISAVAPDLKILDQKALFDMVLEFVLGSEGIPRMWFGSSGETNRASAVEQNSPIHRTLLALQKRLKDIITALVEYLIWLGKRAGRIRPEEDEGFAVQMSAIATRDTQRDVGVLQQLGAAMVLLEKAGYLSKPEAQKVVRGYVASQTTFEAQLSDKPPAAVRTPEEQLESVLGELAPSSGIRAALRKLLPGHRKG